MATPASRRVRIAQAASVVGRCLALGPADRSRLCSFNRNQHSVEETRLHLYVLTEAQLVQPPCPAPQTSRSRQILAQSWVPHWQGPRRRGELRLTDGKHWFAGLCQHPLCTVTLEGSWQAQRPPQDSATPPRPPAFSQVCVQPSVSASLRPTVRQPQQRETKVNTTVGTLHPGWVGG